MNPRSGLLLGAALAVAAFLLPVAHADDGPQSQPSSPQLERDSVQDVIFLSDARPIFIRLRLDAGGKAFRTAWLETVKAMHTYLDRNKDGILTKEEADLGSLPTMVRAATGGAAALPRADLDSNPKDGKVSVEELADVLRPALGPFRVQIGRVAVEKNDALFNLLDRDKDGMLTKDELGGAVTSLHRFDLDSDELIDPNELEPFSNPIAAMTEELTKRGKFAAVPPVIELSAEDPSIRPVRLLLKRYDKGTGAGEAAGDNRLSNSEFGIDPKEFGSADIDNDGALDTEELRRFLSQVGPDLELVVKLSGSTSKTTTIAASAAGSKPLPREVSVKRLSEGDIEVAVGELSLEFHADGGENAVENAKSYYANQFQAADKDNNKYLDKPEVKDHNSPFAALFDTMDADGDGKLYMKEVDAFVEQQTQAARSQMVLSVADQGRAIFAIMDLNRDRRLCVREIRNAVARVSSWDRNGDGHVRSDEIPHHFEMSIGRGKITGVGMPAIAARMESTPAARATPTGPKWFQKMDRNGDGDISRREFLGPRADFERIDGDHDGLINAEEAAKPKK